MNEQGEKEWKLVEQLEWIVLRGRGALAPITHNKDNSMRLALFFQFGLAWCSTRSLRNSSIPPFTPPAAVILWMAQASKPNNQLSLLNKLIVFVWERDEVKEELVKSNEMEGELME